MKRYVKKISSIIGIVVLYVYLVLTMMCECTADFEEDYAPLASGLRLGMTIEEVHAILGMPEEVSEGTKPGLIGEDYVVGVEARPENLDPKGLTKSTFLEAKLYLMYETVAGRQVLYSVAYSEYNKANVNTINKMLFDYANYCTVFYGKYEIIEDLDNYYEWENTVGANTFSASIYGPVPDEDMTTILIFTSILDQYIKDENISWPCSRCGNDHLGGNVYTFELDGNSIYLCEKCRKELLISQEPFNYEGKEYRLFEDYGVFQNCQACFAVPKEYQLKTQEDNYYSFEKQDEVAEFTVLIMFDDVYSLAPEEMSREEMDFKYLFDEMPGEAYQEFLDSYAFLKDEPFESSKKSSDDALYFIYQYDNGIIDAVTVVNGIECRLLGSCSMDPFYMYLDIYTLTNNIVW